MAHKKRLTMPVSWPLPRKTNKWVAAPSAGPHGKDKCLPLLLVVRDTLKIAESYQEARRILNAGKVLVDKRPRKSPNFPVGLMDIIEIPDAGKAYTVFMNEYGLFIRDGDPSKAGHKLCRVMGKSLVRAGKLQLNLHDGKNILLDAKSPKIMADDSVLVSLSDMKITKHIPLQKGSRVLVTAGKNRGSEGTVHEIIERKSMLERSKAVIDTDSGQRIETLKSHVMAQDGVPKPEARQGKPHDKTPEKEENPQESAEKEAEKSAEEKPKPAKKKKASRGEGE